MAKIVLTVIRDMDLIYQVFPEKKGFMYRYLMAQSNGLMNLMDMRLKRYRIYKEKNIVIGVEENEPEVIESRRKDITEFLLSKEKELKKSPEYQRVISNRNLMAKARFATKILGRKIKNKIEITKDKILEHALSGGTVLGFLNSRGISMYVEVVE